MHEPLIAMLIVTPDASVALITYVCYVIDANLTSGNVIFCGD